MTHLPVYQFDFSPGLSAPRGRALRRVQMPGSAEVVERSFGYRFNDTTLVRNIGAILSPPLADALDTSAAIYLADRYAPRVVNGLRQWHRRIHVRIPVRRPVLWRDDRVVRALEGFLAFLTDDEWSIAFIPRTAPLRRAEQQAALLSHGGQPSTLAVLHSGGLDSCLGVIDAAMRHPHGSILAVSAVSHGHLSTVQRAVVTSIRHASSADIIWARLYVGLAGVHRDHQESSQRARGFLYLMTGAVAAALGGASTLQVAENGIGAINLPSAPDQLGTHTTRAMHPVTLARFEQLVTVLVGQPLAVGNAGLWQTKAELCRQVLGSTDDDNKHFADAARHTISCDRFPWIGLRQACGSCTSCLFRRLSLLAAGRRDIDANAIRGYTFDPLSATADWSGNDLTPLYMLGVQAAQLRHALQAPEPFNALVATFPSLTRLYHATAHLGLTEGELQERLVRLYQAYIAEWDQFDRWIHWPPAGAIEPIPIAEPAALAAIAS